MYTNVAENALFFIRIFKFVELSSHCVITVKFGNHLPFYSFIQSWFLGVFLGKMLEEKNERERLQKAQKKLSRSKRAKLKRQQKVASTDNTVKHRKLLYEIILAKKENVMGNFFDMILV